MVLSSWLSPQSTRCNKLKKKSLLRTRHTTTWTLTAAACYRFQSLETSWMVANTPKLPSLVSESYMINSTIISVCTDGNSLSYYERLKHVLWSMPRKKEREGYLSKIAFKVLLNEAGLITSNFIYRKYQILWP